MTALAVAAPLFCVMDVFALKAYPKRTWDIPILRRVIPGTILGIVLGSLALGWMPTEIVAVSVAFIAIVFSVKWLLDRYRSPDGAQTAGFHLPASSGVYWGGLSGITSALAHSGGPPIAVYLLSQKMQKSVYAGTSVIYFAIGNAIKLVPYIVLGLISMPSLLASVIVAPVIPLGIFIGRKLHDRLSQDALYTICYLFTILAAVRMGASAF